MKIDAVSLDSGLGLHQASAAALGGLGLLAGGSGLVVGRNRQGEQVLLSIFRPQPTQVALVGGVRCAQLVALRAVALGARLFIQTAREQQWDEFLQRCGLGRDTAVFAPPGSTPGIAASPTRPQLVIVDTGPTTIQHDRGEPGAWRSTLVLRDELAAGDINALIGADLVMLQRLTDAEAAIAAPAFGLTQSQGWLSRVHPEMVGLIGHGRLQWALLSPTPIERSVLPSVARA